MPPTYSPFWKPFESLARLGLPRSGVRGGDLWTGPVNAVDALGAEEWRRFATAEKLYDAWGPVAISPWSGYHKPTLFAALDSLAPERTWPCVTPGLDAQLAPHVRPRWADERTAIALDLPGAHSVAYAAWLCMRAGHAPISTFNNWPHTAGLVDVARVLGALLHYAPWMQLGEMHMVDEKRAPPVIILDADRLGSRAPKPQDFDNRYFLLETDLPAGPTLANAGIERLVYVRPVRPPGSNAHVELDDVNGWLFDLQERVQVHVAYATLDGWGLTEPERHAPAIRKTPFTTTTDPAFRGFRRNAAGGFGVLVPEPSSGGG